MKKRLRAIKQITVNADIAANRAMQNRYGALASMSQRGKTDETPVDFPDFDACLITPRKPCGAHRAILYLHGGAYVAGGVAYARGFGSVLAVETGLPVLCAAYRLAPEHIFPAALDDALSAYLTLLARGYAGDEVVIAGESAGGGLALALAMRLRDENLPMPEKLVCISPWTELCCDLPSHKQNADADPTLDTGALRMYAKLYANGYLKDPRVSPYYGDCRGLPETLMLAGGDEMLLSDAKCMAEKMAAAGCRVTLDVAPGMWHVYPLFGTPESRAAIEKIVAFLAA